MAPRKKTTTDSTKPARTAVRKTKKTANGEPAKVAKAAKTAVTRKKVTTAVEPPEGVAPARDSGKSLVIVESPAKAKTIQKYLGAGFEVAASFGHVRDLPRNPGRGKIGVDIEAGWVPTYVVDDDRAKKVLADLKKRVARVGAVYLAPDPDREGEAIAWHLKEALNLADERIHRVTFNEITKRAVQDAFAHAGQIDMDRVKSQEARRFLDRAVGYKLSPLLRKKLGAQSAGRVQSVAVRMVVERELEIRAFKPEEYWKITALLSPEGTLKPTVVPVQARVRKKAADVPEGSEPKEEEDVGLKAPPGGFLAELAEWNGQKFQAASEEAAAQVLGALPTAAYLVGKVEQKDQQEKPAAPFTTSTLQQQANIRLGFSTQRTMSSAQRLYEGVELSGEGAIGLITYMRTDSTRVSEEALRACRDHILAAHGQAYLPNQPNRFASGKNAQEAHEAIRPTDVSYTPERVEQLLPQGMERRQDLLRLYTLIYNRFVASQMTPAIWAVTKIDVHATPAGATAAQGVFKTTGKVLKFDGYRKVLPPRGKTEDATLPALTEQQKLDLLDLLGSQHFTQPPPRYNEASLVKAMEKEGIGRPSTYASIIKKIQDRKYVEQRERRFYATDLGILVTERLIQHFPKVMDIKFTRELEEHLDQIEEHKTEWHQVLNDFWGPFSQALTAAQQEMGSPTTGENCPECGKPLVWKHNRMKGTRFAGCSGYPECKYIKREEGDRPAPEETDHKCPVCTRPMLKRMGQRGPFLGCSGYPECKTTMNFDVQGNPVLAAKPTEHVCEKCGSAMVLREGRRGPFLACSGYPKCKNAKDVDAQGNPMKPVETGMKCEKCGADMAVRKGGRGPFLGCTAYPKCRSTKPLPPELKEKLKDLYPAPAKKAPAIEVSETCPECGGPMALREGRRNGWFLGCKKYPKCKGTREATPELVEQAQAATAASS